MDIHIRGNKAEILAALRELPASLARGQGKLGGMGETLAGKLAAAFYGLVEADFKVKSLGGPGSDGHSWAQNTEKTLAYSKGEKIDRQGGGDSPNNRPGGPAAFGGSLGREPGSGELTKSQLKLWWQIYNKRKWQLVYHITGKITIPKGKGKRATNSRRQLLAVSITREIKSRAAAFAWIQLKELGAKRLLDTIGQRTGEILVDKTGRLQKSLEATTTPDTITLDGRYVPDDEQIFEHHGNTIALGSSVPYAATHHFGRAAGLPIRRLWPRNMPDAWNERLAGQVTDTMNELGNALAKHWSVS